jgi:hypothetical protein
MRVSWCHDGIKCRRVANGFRMLSNGTRSVSNGPRMVSNGPKGCQIVTG